MTNSVSQSQQRDADDLEIEITVAGEEFDTIDDAEAYVREQERREAIAEVRECIEEMWGEDAPQNLLEFMVPEDAEPMTFEALALDLIANSASTPSITDTSPQMVAGAMMSGLGKMALNKNL